MFVLGPLESLLILLTTFLLFLLNRSGKISPKTLLAVVASLSTAAFLTPPDPATTILAFGALMGVFIFATSKSAVPHAEPSALEAGEGSGIEELEFGDLQDEKTPN